MRLLKTAPLGYIWFSRAKPQIYADLQQPLKRQPERITKASSCKDRGTGVLVSTKNRLQKQGPGRARPYLQLPQALLLCQPGDGIKALEFGARLTLSCYLGT